MQIDGYSLDATENKNESVLRTINEYEIAGEYEDAGNPANQ